MGVKGRTGNEWVSVSVVGHDRPGIVAGVSKVLFENDCNIEALSQTVLMGQFAMIVVVSLLKGASIEGLQEGLETLARGTGLEIHVHSIDSQEQLPYPVDETEPFVITVRGEDRPGLVAAVTEILAHEGINITRLGAEVVPVGGRQEYIQIYEVDIPNDLDFARIQHALSERGAEIGVAVDMQHRDIFRAINQI